MSLSDAIRTAGHFQPPAVPEIRYLTSAVDRVRERWPDIEVKGDDREREALALSLRDKVERNDWTDTSLSFMVSAATAVFDLERKDRPDLARTREFFYAEVRASSSATFLTGLLRAYLEGYVPGAAQTRALAAALRDAEPRMGPATRILLDAVPELLDPDAGPDRLAARMVTMSDPYVEIRNLGVRNPHAFGFMDHVHLSITELIRPELADRARADWYIGWLRPIGKEEARTTGAERSIEALVHPWLRAVPEDGFRSHLVETLIEFYGDPRIQSGRVWAGVDPQSMAVIHRWLTREDMRFFTGVVDAVQNDDMWIRRRDFWLKLYDEGLIDAAWAALSDEAFAYARDHLMRQGARNAYSRVGYQRARQNTSLLILKIGNKIMVDGCHNYRTHVFDIGDRMAPKLFQEGYDCLEIMNASDDRPVVAAKSHRSIQAWGRWVRDMINADVQRSRQTQPYQKVPRPRPPQERPAPARGPAMARHADRQTAWRGPGMSTAGQDLLTPRGSAPSPSTWSADRSMDQAPASPAVIAAARQGPAEVRGPSPSTPVEPASLKTIRFPSLTDRMIAYGPAAAESVLAYLEAPEDGRTRPLLSLKSREGLAWVRAVRGDPPFRLRNALEHLLIALRTGGVDLDDLFASSATPSSGAGLPTGPSNLPQGAAVSAGQTFPPLPDHADDRLHLLRLHADALEALGMQKPAFDQRKAVAVAVRKLKERSPDLQVNEVAEMLRLYESLRAMEAKTGQ